MRSSSHILISLTLILSLTIACGSHSEASAASIATLSATGDVTLLAPADTRKAGPYDPSLTIAPDGQSDAVSYLRFDPASIPLRAHIESASLALSFSGVAPKSIVLHVCDGAWHELSLNRKNAPALEKDAIELKSMEHGAGETARYSCAALASLVGEWLIADRPNFGFAVMLPSESYLKEASFSSKEDPAASKRPALIVTYSDTASSPQSGNATLGVPWKSDARDVAIATQNVRNFGAKGDGRTDDSAAFAAALAAAVKAGGGIVYAPAGQYRFEHNIAIPTGITLRGDWAAPQDGGLGKGTIIEVVAGRGDVDGIPFMDMGVSAGLTDLTFYYPDQNASTAVPYPYTIRSQFSAFMRHLTFVNAYRAISHGYGSISGGNLLAEHIYGTPLDVGMNINFGYDFSCIASVRFSPVYWPAFDAATGKRTPGMALAVAKWTYAHATGIVTGHSGANHGCGIEVDGYRRGMCFGSSVAGVWMGGHLNTTNDAGLGSGSFGQYYDLRLTNCAEALRIDEIHEIGMVFSGCRFDGDISASISTTWAIVFDQCRFRGKNASLKCISHAAQVSILSSTFAGSGEVRFETGRVTLTNNRFEATTPRVLSLDKNVQAAVLAGNRFACSPGYVDESSRAIVQAKPLDMPPWPDAPGGTNPLRSPHSAHVVDASAAPFNSPTDGIADASHAVQAALDSLAADGGTVFLPAGQYLLKEPIIVPPRVEIRGVGEIMAHPVDKGYLSPTDITGTAFLVDNGQANESAPAAITLGADSGVRGVTIVHQARRVPGEMIPFPSAILGKGDRCYVEGCDLIDPFLAIKMDHVDDYLIKDIYTGTDHLGVQVVGGKGGIIENFAAHGQFLAAGIPHTWGMPKYPSTIAQLQKTTTAIQIEGATDQLVQACGQYGLRNGYIVQGGPDGKPCTVLFRLVTDDSVTGDGLRLEGNARIVAIGYENLTTYLAKSLVTTPSFSGDALLAGDILRTMILSCAGTGRTEVRGATILWVPGKVYVDGGRVFVRASLSNITNVTVAPDAAFRAEANIDERNALQTARTSNCMFVSNAAVAK